jgi:hypothetical protein
MALSINPYKNQAIFYGKGGGNSYQGYSGDFVARLGKGDCKEAISLVYICKL